MKAGVKVALFLLLVLGVIVIGGASMRPSPSGSSQRPPPPPPPPFVTHYSATLSNTSWYTVFEYQDRTPSHTYFFILNVTVRNTGNTALDPTYLQWSLRDIDGILVAFAESTFYSAMRIESGGNATGRLVFDLYSFSEPAKIRLSLPDGVSVSKFL